MLSVVKGNKPDNDVDKCAVHLQGKSETFDNFIAVGLKPTGELLLNCNTDVITIGQAIKLLQLTFAEMFAELSIEDKLEVSDVLKTLNIGEGLVYE